MTTFSFTGEIPIDVMSTLTRLVGAAYPSATMVPGASLTFQIDDGDRADPSVFERAAELKVEAEEHTTDTSMRITADGVEMDPGEYLVNVFGQMVRQALDFHEAENFLEFEFSYKGSRLDGTYMLTVSRSPEQRPAVLLAAEKRRAEAAQARVDELTELLRRVGADDGVRTSIDEFAAELGIALD